MSVMVGTGMLVVLLALAAACGGDDGHAGTGTGPPDTPATSDIDEPLRRPKSTDVPLTITPPPIKPPSGPTDRLKPITVAGTLAEPVPGCLVVEAENGRWELAGTLPEGFGVGDRVEVAGRPAPEVEGSCGAPVIRVRDIRPA